MISCIVREAFNFREGRIGEGRDELLRRWSCSHVEACEVLGNRLKDERTQIALLMKCRDVNCEQSKLMSDTNGFDCGG